MGKTQREYFAILKTPCCLKYKAPKDDLDFKGYHVECDCGVCYPVWLGPRGWEFKNREKWVCNVPSVEDVLKSQTPTHILIVLFVPANVDPVVIHSIPAKKKSNPADYLPIQPYLPYAVAGLLILNNQETENMPDSDHDDYVRTRGDYDPCQPVDPGRREWEPIGDGCYRRVNHPPES